MQVSRFYVSKALFLHVSKPRGHSTSTGELYDARRANPHSPIRRFPAGAPFEVTRDDAGADEATRPDKSDSRDENSARRTRRRNARMRSNSNGFQGRRQRISMSKRREASLHPHARLSSSFRPGTNSIGVGGEPRERFSP